MIDYLIALLRQDQFEERKSIQWPLGGYRFIWCLLVSMWVLEYSTDSFDLCLTLVGVKIIRQRQFLLFNECRDQSEGTVDPFGYQSVGFRSSSTPVEDAGAIHANDARKFIRGQPGPFKWFEHIDSNEKVAVTVSAVRHSQGEDWAYVVGEDTTLTDRGDC